MSLGPEDLTTAANSLKSVYSPEELELIICKKRPFVAAIKKANDFVGEDYKHTVQHGFNQSAGPTVALARSTISTNSEQRFTLDRKQYYGYGKISRELILATKEKRGSVANKYKQAMDGMIFSLSRFLDYATWSNGGGAYGRLALVGVADGLLATQVKLANPAGAMWLESDMQLQFSANNGYGPVLTVRQPGGGVEGAASTGITLTILAVNKRTGLITFTGAVPVAAGEVTVDDYIFRVGSKGLVIDGVRGWIPQDDTTAASAYLGATRSAGTERLAGHRWLDPLATYAETIREACAQFANEGMDSSNIYMNPKSIVKIEASERDRVVTKEVGRLEIGFDTIMFKTAIGDLDLQSEPAVPPGWAFVTNPDSWTFKHLGEMVGFFEEAGLLQRVVGEDNYDFEGGGYGNLLCDLPGNSGWVKLDADAAEF